MSTGQNIKNARVEKGLSTYRISELTGISQSGISKLENGKRSIKVDDLIRIAKALGVTATDLIEKEGE